MAFKLSNHGKKLIKQYEIMGKEGFQRTDGSKVPSVAVYNSFQLKKFRYVSKDYFVHNKISTVLDYGAGGSDWSAGGFDDKISLSAKQFFNVQVLLICSTQFSKGVIYEPHKYKDWLFSEKFEVPCKFQGFSMS